VPPLLTQRLLAYLSRIGRDASLLSDGFYLRVGAALGGRLSKRQVVLSLLSKHGEAAENTAHGVSERANSSRKGGSPIKPARATNRCKFLAGNGLLPGGDLIEPGWRAIFVHGSVVS
jgi:hypothetical protein